MKHNFVVDASLDFLLVGHTGDKLVSLPPFECINIYNLYIFVSTMIVS